MTYSVVNTLAELRTALEELYIGISDDCKGCTYPDCKGFIYVLDEEIDTLLDVGVEIVKVNKTINFLNNFNVNEAGDLDLSVIGPLCKQRCSDTGLCTINHIKPIICSLYPILPDTDEDGEIFWALHSDCKFSERIFKEGKFEELKAKFIELLNHMDTELYNKIVSASKEVDTICYFPNGYNRMFKIKGV